MTTKLSDLRVAINQLHEGPCVDVAHERPASVADLVAALIAEGGEIRSWCDEHDGQGTIYNTACWVGVNANDWGACRMVERLVFPIPVESAEAKETP